MERAIDIKHVTLQISAGFDAFTQQLETLLGRFDYAAYAGLDGNPKLVEKQLQAWAGEQGLMLFNIQDHGKLLKLAGMQRKAKRSTTFARGFMRR